MRSDAGPWGSPLPLGIHLRLRRWRRLLYGLDLTAGAGSSRRLGGEAKLLRQPKRGSRPVDFMRCTSTSGAEGIRPDRSDKTLKWETRRLEDILERVIPHFERYPLLSGKRLDFRAFRSRSVGYRRRECIGRETVCTVRIVELTRGMNPSGRRRYAPEAILAQLRQGEGIVCASGNGGDNAKFRPARMA